jgi:Leucine-rich repeat (LRR) protein
VLLEDLNLAGNELRVIPTQFGELVNLTSLDLSKNKLIALPKRLANLAKLQRLFLNNNLFGDKIDSGVDVPLSPRGGLDPAIDEALGTSPSRRPKKKSRRRSTVLPHLSCCACDNIPFWTLPISDGASGQDDGETSDDGYKSDSKIAPRITSSPDRGSLTARAQSTVVISPRTGLSSDGVYRNVTHEDISSGDQVYLVDFPFGKLDALSTLHLQSNRLSRFPKFISNCM